MSDKLFIVMDGDCDSAWAVAIYRDKELAERHSSWIGGWVSELEVSDNVPDDVDNPQEIERREKAGLEARERYKRESEQRERAAERSMAYTIQDGSRPNLCKCCTFSNGDFITPNGYCRYCGGFTPEIIREKLGNVYLQERIDELALHDREAIRGILAGTRPRGLTLG